MQLTKTIFPDYKKFTAFEISSFVGLQFEIRLQNPSIVLTVGDGIMI